MQHNLIRQPRRIMRIPLTPIIRDRIRKDTAGSVEARRTDTAAYFRIPLQPVFGVFVPEVEGSVAAGCGEGAVDRVEGDGVYGEDFGVVSCGGVGLAVAFEGEVFAVAVLISLAHVGLKMRETNLESFSLAYWIAHRPSILPTANPLASEKQLTTLVCHFNGLCTVLNAAGLPPPRSKMLMYRSAQPTTMILLFRTSMV